MVVVAEPTVRSLSGLRPHYRGRNGDRGSGGYRIGASGRTAIIKVSVDSGKCYSKSECLHFLATNCSKGVPQIVATFYLTL